MLLHRYVIILKVTQKWEHRKLRFTSLTFFIIDKDKEYHYTYALYMHKDGITKYWVLYAMEIN